MYFTFEESIDFATQYYDELVQLVIDLDREKHNLIICPSMIVLSTLSQIFKTTNMAFGAQDCSDHSKGAFTGQVSAESLKQVGCEYCIIGHSEQRLLSGQTDSMIAHKFAQLIKENITPIICIGESKDQFESGRTIDIISQQLDTILDSINAKQYLDQNLSVCIAYEPVWSIGTGDVPSKDHLENIFSWISVKVKKIAPYIDWKLIYGGSVVSKNIVSIAKNEFIDGFLIGGASLDFQELKKIVHCTLIK